MQGAIMPLSETFASDRPFLGVVLAGVFTEGSITQLRSHGFGVLYFPFESLVAAFKQVGIDAYFDESSPDRIVQRKVTACSKLRDSDWNKVATHLRRLHRGDLQVFLHELEVSLSRAVQTVFVLALHGRSHEAATIDDRIITFRRDSQHRVAGFSIAFWRVKSLEFERQYAPRNKRECNSFRELSCVSFLCPEEDQQELRDRLDGIVFLHFLRLGLDGTLEIEGVLCWL